MSDPFVYNPPPSYPAFAGATSGYYNTGYSPAPASPFIPSTGLSHSPYTSPYHRAGSLPPSPYLGAAHIPGSPSGVMFPTSDGYETLSTWNQPTRARRPSWHGQPDSGPFFQSGFLGVEGEYFRDRRHSHHSSPYTASVPLPPWSAYPHAASAYTPFPAIPQIQIHPWLNGETPRGDFVFDLSLPAFLPRRLSGPRQTVPITAQDLAQPATHPPVSSMRIVCDAIPQWPIDLKYNPYSDPAQTLAATGSPPPITLGDVLVAVHSAMHRRISHLDWARLSISEEAAVTKVYSRRCRSYGPEREVAERNDGVKRVDFLLGKVWMRGLVPTGEPGVMKLILT